MKVYLYVTIVDGDYKKKREKNQPHMTIIFQGAYYTEKGICNISHTLA